MSRFTATRQLAILDKIRRDLRLDSSGFAERRPTSPVSVEDCILFLRETIDFYTNQSEQGGEGDSQSQPLVNTRKRRQTEGHSNHTVANTVAPTRASTRVRVPPLRDLPPPRQPASARSAATANHTNRSRQSGHHANAIGRPLTWA